jgi:hypothetical protein
LEKIGFTLKKVNEDLNEQTVFRGEQRTREVKTCGKLLGTSISEKM